MVRHYGFSILTAARFAYQCSRTIAFCSGSQPMTTKEGMGEWQSVVVVVVVRGTALYLVYFSLWVFPLFFLPIFPDWDNCKPPQRLYLALLSSVFIFLFLFCFYVDLFACLVHHHSPWSYCCCHWVMNFFSYWLQLFRQIKRQFQNFIVFFIPWEKRIKNIQGL